ncbi:MAG: DnaB-like helicase C-terminal domain-containing protein, partial [Patescibacteria group bacterium]
WLSSLGVMGKLATEKQIPSEIFELNKNNVALFLNRLYACEGSVILPKVKGCGHISFASSSYELAEGVKHLLLRFGILAKLRNKKVKYRGTLRNAYEIEIEGANDVLTFAQEIGIFGKEKKLEIVKKAALSKQFAKNFSKDTLPMETWKLVLEEKGELTWREIYKRMGRPLTHNIHVNRRQLRRETLMEIALALKSSKLLDLAKSDVYWDRVVSIKPSGVKNVFDLSVDKTHNFIANDIVVHNTSLVLNIMQNLAVNHKRPVAMFSLEMSKEELVDRLLVAQADIDSWKLKTGKLNEEDFTKLSNAMGELAEAPIFIDDQPGQTILEMRTKARRLQVENGIDLLVVDYLQLAQGKNKENRVQEVAEISQGLKNLARELKIPLLACAQLSRAVESRDVKRPQLSDLRESGCLLGDTLISLSDTGERKKIEDLVGMNGFSVFALDQDLKIKPAVVSKVFSSGKKMVYKLTLRSGKTIKASANHPFLMLDNWVRLDNLKVGDKLATPRKLSFNLQAGDKISDNKLIVLAHMIGDGCYVKRQPLHYTNSDMKLINIVKNAAQAEFDVKPRVVPQQSWYHLYLSSAQPLARGRRNPIVKWFDEELGIYGQHSREKYVPNAVFNLSNSKIALFLKHLWATDGCISVTDTKRKRDSQQIVLYYSTGSERLARDVAHLLLRFGIVSTIRKGKKKGYQDMWTVNIQGKLDQTTFLKEIGIAGKKDLLVKKATNYLKNIESNPNTDVVPKEIWKFIEGLRVDNNLSSRAFHAQLGWAYSGTQRHGNGISRDRLRKIMSVLADEKLKNLSESDIFWDEVKQVEKIGIKEVYDMTVPVYSNFIANDIIVHNSIEQDADVVMFLWRENEEDASQIVLDIAKHRNGPVGNVKLFFKGDRSRFYEREVGQKSG